MLRLARYLLVPFLVGALSISAAWAGAGLVPAPATSGAAAKTNPAALAQTIAATPDPQVRAGAAKISIAPQPGEGDVWQTEDCKTFGEDADQAVMHAGDIRNRFPESPNCIYAGGYGLGPMNPITSVDPYGLWVRTVAVGDGSDTLVMTILDGTSYFGRYNEMCDGCGAFDLASELGAELGIDPSGFMIASTHSHTAPDFIGGWGGVPQWYMDQVADAIRTSIRDAVAGMKPAVIESGDVLARAYGGERRDFYRSAEDSSLGWFRALEIDDKGRPTGATIATVGAFAAHPVTVDSNGTGDADFPAVFASRVEDRFGGVGAYFMTGLGNVSPRGDKFAMGNGLADLLPGVGEGRIVPNADVATSQQFFDQPVTNSGLTALGLPGFFDRPFGATPAALRTGKSPDRKPCTSASAVSVNTAVSAARIGDLVVTGAPGETFSNLSATLKERNPNAVTLPLAQVNDGLGYILQSFETDHAGRQAVGFVGEVAEYEDAYSMDHCFGDHVLETTIGLVNNLFAR